MNNNFASSTLSVIIWCIIPWHNCFNSDCFWSWAALGR